MAPLSYPIHSCWPSRKAGLSSSYCLHSLTLILLILVLPNPFLLSCQTHFLFTAPTSCRPDAQLHCDLPFPSPHLRCGSGSLASVVPGKHCSYARPLSQPIHGQCSPGINILLAVGLQGER